MTESSRAPRADTLLALWQAQMRGQALLLLDVDGSVVDAFGAVEEILGFTLQEVNGLPLARIFTPEDLALELDTYELKTAAVSGYASDDRWHLRKDGSRIWVSGMLTALRDASGGLAGYAKLMRDRTDLRGQIEMLENRTTALNAATQVKDTALATLAHELRNPLAPLANAVQLMRLTVNDERLRYPLQIIDRQIAQLKRLVEDMTQVSRLEFGKVELDIRPLELQAELTQAVEQCRPAALQRRHSLVALMPEVPITLEADAVRLEQILVNLLNNAIKYTPPGGHIWLKATVEQTQAVIRIEDDGEGISAAVLPRIFDLFTQEPRVAAEGEGLGIGLALVKSLVSLHHGLVEVRSDGPGRGSEFVVRLPLRQPILPAADD